MAANFALKTLQLIMGWICLLLGAIGAVLPIMPTVPFLLLAAYFFSKSSPKVHSWLTRLPHFGDAIIDWEKNRVIRPKAKFGAVFCIVVMFGVSIGLTSIHYGLKLMLVVIALLCIAFITTRKSSADA